MKINVISDSILDKNKNSKGCFESVETTDDIEVRFVD